MATTTTAELYRKPYLPTFSYALGLLLFLLPFFDIKCNNMTVAQLKGIDVAFGTRPNLSGDLENIQNSFGGQRTDETAAPAKQKGEGHLILTALIAFLLGVVGLVLSLVNKGRNQRPNMIVGALGAVALIASWIQVTAYVSDNAKSTDGNTDTGGALGGMVSVSASPTFWFVLCVVCFGVSAYYCYKQSQRQDLGEMPPRQAPQVHIENPGEQSEFPAAPHEDRDLG